MHALDFVQRMLAVQVRGLPFVSTRVVAPIAVAPIMVLARQQLKVVIAMAVRRITSMLLNSHAIILVAQLKPLLAFSEFKTAASIRLFYKFLLLLLVLMLLSLSINTSSAASSSKQIQSLGSPAACG